MILTRRSLLGWSVGLAILQPGVSAIAQPLTVLRIGYQKTGLPVIAQQQKTIEKELAPEGVKVQWVEFVAGPPLLEAMNAGSVDIGYTGDAPPIFAEAAGANVVYVAALPGNGAGEAIIVRKDSPIHSLADLKGRKIAFTQGSSAHKLVLAALAKAKLNYSDIQPEYLSPPDAAAAFTQGSVDAWSIWDPFLALAQVRYAPRTLVVEPQAEKANSFELANGAFAKAHPKVVALALKGLAEAAHWAASHRADVAQSLAAVTGVPLAAQKIAADRAEFSVFPINADIIARQQQAADEFFKLNLIPKRIVVRDAVWTPPQT
jgi:sulfonate transport system substrate-binding protein